MEELQDSHRVLDLGSGAGSLKSFGYPCLIVSLDCDNDAFAKAYDGGSSIRRVVGLGGSLPFATATFDLVLCNHVLEHVQDLTATLVEISRVLKPAGRLYVAVPNGHGLCDAIYRYLFEGGDHVNRFSRDELTTLVQRTIGVRLTGWQKLYSSFSYLSRLGDLDPAVVPMLAPRLRRLAALPTSLLVAVQVILYVCTRLADWLAGVDWALYGWALYFEHVTPTYVREDRPYLNVCLYCGSGHATNELRRRFVILYTCPTCGHLGFYFPRFRNAR